MDCKSVQIPLLMHLDSTVYLLRQILKCKIGGVPFQQTEITERSDHLSKNSPVRQPPLLFVLAAKNMVNVLLSKLPCDGLQKTPSSEVMVNICGALNHLVTCSYVAAREITYYNGLPKLVGIKTFHDNR